MSKKLKFVIVFDLDDTLYFEEDYIISGKLAISKAIFDIYRKDIYDDLKYCKSDFLNFACRTLNLPSSVVQSLLWVYRLHYPKLCMREGMSELLSNLVGLGYCICILTDGRSATQRLKLSALGLSHLPVYVSEELGCEKPSTRGFCQIESDYPSEQYVYVGDNLAKDFIAPNALGWHTCYLDPGSSGIHPKIEAKNMSNSQRPRLRVDTVMQLQRLLLSL